MDDAGRQAPESPAPGVGRAMAVYTGLRLGLFAAVLLLLLAVGLPSFPALLLALLISLVASVVVLRSQRDQLARALESRAERSQARRAHEQHVRDHVAAQRRADGTTRPE